METVYYTHMESPVGRLLLAGNDGELRMLSFTLGPKARLPDAAWKAAAEPFAEAVSQLNGYFRGERREFALRLAPVGTAFQVRVWDALREIPYGNTLSYGDLARKVGNPNASRAVGLANGSNPIAVIIPCHRVIGSTGNLTGFGGGLDIKRRLLELERGQTLL